MTAGSGHGPGKPPNWSSRLLRWFLKPSYYEDIQGDLDEEFQIQVNNKSIAKARFWYNWQIVRLFRPSMMRKPQPAESVENSTTMFMNYLKIGWRNLRKYKAASFINLVGLSTGLASFILIALFVRDELSYDKHFTGVEDIYRVTVKNYNRSGELNRHWAFASAGHAERLKEDYAQIESAVRFYPWAFPDLEYGDKLLPGEPIIFSDNDVFAVFDFEFLQGDAETAFSETTSLVLTEQSAIKIFGTDWSNQEVIGKSVKLSSDGNSAPFTVTGVIADMPDQQHFHFEYLAPLRFLTNIFDPETFENVGGNYNWLTYVRLSPGVDPVTLATGVNDEFWDKYIGEFRSGVRARDFYDLVFQPILDIHLKSNLEGEYETNGSYQQVVIFGVIGILLLLVACVNYMNLATSHFTRRMKEVGVRKVAGAQRLSLVSQFLTESVLITVLSIPVALGLVYFCLPYLNQFMDKSLTLSLISDIGLVFSLIGLMLVVAMISGLYPSLFLSRINLVLALKGEQAVKSNRWNFRSVLVGFQYTVTIGLVFTIFVIESQLSFIQNTNPGYQKERLLNIYLSRNISNLDLFKTEVLKHPQVASAGYASRIPTGRLLDNMGASIFQGDSLVPTSFRLPMIRIDEDFLKVFDIPVIAGENFVREQDSRRDSVGYYIINRKASEALGYNNPQDIIGERLSYGFYNGQTNEDGSTYRIGRIQGVVEDFHFESMHTEIVPMVMIKTNRYRRMIVKIAPGDMQGVISHLENIWSDFDPKNNLEYQFVDELFNEQYQQEERLGTMIRVFTSVAMLICALGVLGMVGFVVETKLKEIGIRKVLGATRGKILYLISNQFLVLMSIAALIALPLGYWLMSGWLDGFVYRATIGVVMLLSPIVVTVLLTGVVISYQTIKATSVNPVECLKDE